MALVTEFSPIGHLTDLTTVTQLLGWSRTVEKMMNDAVGTVERSSGRGKGQFADPSILDMGAATATPISWFGFPNSLLASGYSSDDAYKIADGLMKDSDGLSGRDVQDEYLEWYVWRDVAGEITQIDFTTEGPEYWTTLVDEIGKAAVLGIYQKYYPAAKLTDLFKGSKYDINNIYNTTKGCMHLRQKNNFLSAEVFIAALSTLTYTHNGTILTNGADLCNFASLGVAARNSDPHIAETVNALARQGRRLSILDPVGLYMSDTPDFTGWKTPDGSDPAKLWTVQRGSPTTRGSLKSSTAFKLSDVLIGGQKLQYGGQVAELINIHLTGLYSVPNAVTPTTVSTDQLHTAALEFMSLGVHKTKSFVTITGR